MSNYIRTLLIFVLSIIYFASSCLTPVYNDNRNIFRQLIQRHDFTRDITVDRVTQTRSIQDKILIIKSDDGEDSDEIVNSFRNKIREMMLHAWNGYKKYAWGANELSPLSKKAYHGGVFGKNDIGLTIIDALDTLYIMGLSEEYKEGRHWVQENFSLDDYEGSIDAFEATIRIVGSFLSMYSLTGDNLFKDRAKYVVDKLLPVFETPTGIPKAMINLRTNQTGNYEWAYGGSSLLSQYGSLHLEFDYLTDITGESAYKTHVESIRDVLFNLRKPYNLYPIYINPDNAEWGLHYISIGAYGDSFYEYLLKSWIQCGYKDDTNKKMFVSAIDSIKQHLIGKSFEHSTYLGLLKFGELEPKMDHLACFAPGLFALAGHLLNKTEYVTVAEQIIETCHKSYINSGTGLGPEHFWFVDPGNEARATKLEESRFALRPETIESYFYMWRTTKDVKYREWGWEFVQSLERHCRTPNGYSGVKNVYDTNTGKDDIQHSYFLAETLKYLYLLYSDNSLLSLDKWVFNTEGHPLPIKYM